LAVSRDWREVVVVVFGMQAAKVRGRVERMRRASGTTMQGRRSMMGRRT
jgi:hypothetical protein